ncbi:MAG: glutamate racemase [Deltaproteobacteria bacterium]|nr:glutamate racemase [Deltaproteobacteria bacterium]
MKFNRIGVFDSGIGGLTVLRELLSLVPHTDMIYLGDCARLPYGTKSPKTVIRYSLQCAEFVVSKGIDIMVVACNTASAHAIPNLEKEFAMPVFGVIEAGARAAVRTGAEKIGVIATPATIKSGAYETTLKTINPNLKIYTKACPLFVPLVEEGLFDDEVTDIIARRYLDSLINSDIQTLLLGCTHYPLMKGLLARIMGTDITVVDSALSIASTIAGMVEPGDRKSKSRIVEYYLTDISPRFIELGSLFLGHEMEYVYEVDLGV